MYSSKVFYLFIEGLYYCTTNSDPCTINTNLGWIHFLHVVRPYCTRVRLYGNQSANDCFTASEAWGTFSSTNGDFWIKANFWLGYLGGWTVEMNNLVLKKYTLWFNVKIELLFINSYKLFMYLSLSDDLSFNPTLQVTFRMISQNHQTYDGR